MESVDCHRNFGAKKLFLANKKNKRKKFLVKILMKF